MSTEGMAIRNNEKALFRSAEELRVSSTKDRAIELGKRTGAKPSKQSKTRADILYAFRYSQGSQCSTYISRHGHTHSPSPSTQLSLWKSVH